MSGSECPTTPKSSCRQEKYRRNSKQWRERFRKGCMERLRQSRTRLVERVRNVSQPQPGEEQCSSPDIIARRMADEIMREELSILEGEESCSCCENRSYDVDVVTASTKALQTLPYVLITNLAIFSKILKGDLTSDINEMLAVMEEIRAELIKEEQIILGQYQEFVKFDEDCLCAAINCLSTERVICPVCSRNNLSENKQVIFCSCGLRIDTQCDGINLLFLKEQLNYILELHGKGCDLKPTFSQAKLDLLDIENLIASCQSCDFMEIVV